MRENEKPRFIEVNHVGYMENGMEKHRIPPRKELIRVGDIKEVYIEQPENMRIRIKRLEDHTIDEEFKEERDCLQRFEQIKRLLDAE